MEHHNVFFSCAMHAPEPTAGAVSQQRGEISLSRGKKAAFRLQPLHGASGAPDGATLPR